MLGAVRTAACRCGAVEVECRGEPVRVSVCHCLACQRRTGSVFSAQARFAEADVGVSGVTREWSRTTDSGRKATYRFCPECGSTVAYVNEGIPGLVAVPLGALADPTVPAPDRSVYERRQAPWVAILGEAVDHQD